MTAGEGRAGQDRPAGNLFQGPGGTALSPALLQDTFSGGGRHCAAEDCLALSAGTGPDRHDGANQGGREMYRLNTARLRILSA